MKPRGMSKEVLRDLTSELQRARAKYPNPPRWSTVQHFMNELHISLENHKIGKGYAGQIGANALVVAALVIRIHEEGCEGYPYRVHRPGELNLEDD